MLQSIIIRFGITGLVSSLALESDNGLVWSPLVAGYPNLNDWYVKITSLIPSTAELKSI